MASVNNKEHNKRVMERIVVGNKKLMDEKVRKEKEKEEQLLMDSITHLERKRPINQNDGERKIDAILHYYR